MHDVRTIKVSTSLEYQMALMIRREVFIREQNIAQELEIDEYDNQATHFLCLRGNEPLSTGRLRIKNPFIKFERIATLKEHRGTGYGRHLMDYMQLYAQVQFPEYLPALHAQKTAEMFYQKLGWKVYGEPFLEAHMPHVFLCRP